MILFRHSFAEGANIGGQMTYRKDFMRTVEPMVEQYGADDRVIVSTHTETPPDIARDFEADRIVQVLHTMDYLFDPSGLEAFTAGGLPTRFITHYKAVAKKINNDTPYRAFYVPMTVDTDSLPKPMQKRNGSVIYFGNLYEEKIDTHGKIVAQMVRDCDCLSKFDTLSFGHFNFDFAKQYSHRQCLEIVSEYDVGIGVGRCALEMMAMGCKVIIAGNHWGGVIDTDNLFDFHRKWNFNSRGASAAPFPENLFNKLSRARESTWKPDLKKLDMKHMARTYARIICWSDKQMEALKQPEIANFAQ